MSRYNVNVFATNSAPKRLTLSFYYRNHFCLYRSLILQYSKKSQGRKGLKWVWIGGWQIPKQVLGTRVLRFPTMQGMNPSHPRLWEVLADPYLLGPPLRASLERYYPLVSLVLVYLLHLNNMYKHTVHAPLAYIPRCGI